MRRTPLLLRAAGLLVLAVSLLAGCANTYDAAGGLSRQDYTDLHNASAGLRDGPGSQPAPAIPALRPLTVLPQLPADPRLVSVSLTETVPVREALVMLATRMNMDYDLDPRITGGIAMRANDRPFGEVIERIAHLAGLRYRVEMNRLRVELDEPYIRNYSLATVNLLRRAGTAATSAAGALGGGGGGGGGGAGTGGGGGLSGSTSTLRTETQVDFWQEVTLNVSQILKSLEDQKPLRLPIASEAREPAGNFSALAYGAGITATSRATFSVNRQAGVLSLYATERQQREVERYLNRVMASVNQQVHIDARIVEVALNKQFQSGINWDAVARRAGIAISGVFGGVNTPAMMPSSGQNGVAVGITRSNVSAIINILDNYGTTRTLSSPRITVMNNQMGVMKVARDLVYFRVNIQRDAFQGTLGGNIAQNITTTSTPVNVPVGLVLSVQPAVDVDTRMITLAIRPSVSRVESFVNDPAVTIQAAQVGLSGIQSQVPVIDVNEFDSVVNMRSGQVVVMGGLRQTAISRSNSGLPLLKEQPGLGLLFGSRDDNDQTSELVIFLRAVLSDEEGVSPADRRIYETFVSDPRPLVF